MTDNHLRLMAVHAHPDDEASKGAGTMARYVADGARVKVVTCTGGERGSILNPALQDDEELLRDIIPARRREMAAAAKVLGIEHSWLGFVDSGLPEGDPLPPLPEGSFAAVDMEEPVKALVAQIREFRPHVMACYDENGGYPHPDHVRAHEISMEAFDKAADQNYYPDAGPAWAVQKLYYDVSFSITRLLQIHEAVEASGMDSPFAEWVERRQKRDADTGRVRRPATARINVADYFHLRDDALRAHASQVDPEGFFFAIPREIEAEVWPWEEFEIVLSRVEPGPGMEDDLFAGVVPEGIDPPGEIVVVGADLARTDETSHTGVIGTGHTGGDLSEEGGQEQ